MGEKGLTYTEIVHLKRLFGAGEKTLYLKRELANKMGIHSSSKGFNNIFHALLESQAVTYERNIESGLYFSVDHSKIIKLINKQEPTRIFADYFNGTALIGMEVIEL